MSEGPATQALMEQLHGAVRLHLWRRLRSEGRVPTDILAVTRTFLADNRVHVNDEASRKALQRIQSLYELRIVEALERPNPPASLLHEARHWFESQRVSKSQQPEPLPDTGLPFQL